MKLLPTLSPPSEFSLEQPVCEGVSVLTTKTVLTIHENGDFAHTFHGLKVPCVIGRMACGLGGLLGHDVGSGCSPKEAQKQHEEAQ